MTLLTRAETAEWLSCSVSQLDKLRAEGVVPSMKISGMIRFPKELIEQTLMQRNLRNYDGQLDE